MRRSILRICIRFTYFAHSLLASMIISPSFVTLASPATTIETTTTTTNRPTRAFVYSPKYKVPPHTNNDTTIGNMDRQTTSNDNNSSSDDNTLSEEEEFGEEEELFHESSPFPPTSGKLYRLRLAENVDLYLLGTAHISNHSCRDAESVMRHVRPHVLFIELCAQRLDLLLPPSTNNNNNMDEHEMDSKKNNSNRRRWKRNKCNDGMSKSAAWSSTLLSKIQKDYANKLGGIDIGGEFRTAYRMAQQQQQHFDQHRQQLLSTGSSKNHIAMVEWKGIGVDIAQHNRKTAEKEDTVDNNPPTSSPNNLFFKRQDTTTATVVQKEREMRNGCIVILGDRPVRLTLLRAWESLSTPFGKAKLLLSLMYSSIFQRPSRAELMEWMNAIVDDPNNDLLCESIRELSVRFPTLSRVIIEERDWYLVSKLLQTVRFLERDGTEKKRIVALVGAGHTPGMIYLLRQWHIHTKNQNHPPPRRKTVWDETSPEDVLVRIIETKNYRATTNPDIRSLVTDVTELHFPLM